MKGNIKNIEIAGIQAAVPCNEVDNMQYISQLSNHRIKKQIELTGIKKRRVTLEKQKASDLATEAAKKLMKTLKWKETEVEVLIFVTQSPDLQRPSTAFLIQNRLGLSSSNNSPFPFVVCNILPNVMSPTIVPLHPKLIS